MKSLKNIIQKHGHFLFLAKSTIFLVLPCSADQVTPDLQQNSIQTENLEQQPEVKFDNTSVKLNNQTDLFLGNKKLQSSQLLFSNLDHHGVTGTINIPEWNSAITTYSLQPNRVNLDLSRSEQHIIGLTSSSHLINNSENKLKLDFNNISVNRAIDGNIFGSSGKSVAITSHAFSNQLKTVFEHAQSSKKNISQTSDDRAYHLQFHYQPGEAFWGDTRWFISSQNHYFEPSFYSALNPHIEQGYLTHKLNIGINTDTWKTEAIFFKKKDNLKGDSDNKNTFYEQQYLLTFKPNSQKTSLLFKNPKIDLAYSEAQQQQESTEQHLRNNFKTYRLISEFDITNNRIQLVSEHHKRHNPSEAANNYDSWLNTGEIKRSFREKTELSAKLSRQKTSLKNIGEEKLEDIINFSLERRLNESTWSKLSSQLHSQKTNFHSSPEAVSSTKTDKKILQVDINHQLRQPKKFKPEILVGLTGTYEASKEIDKDKQQINLTLNFRWQ